MGFYGLAVLVFVDDQNVALFEGVERASMGLVLRWVLLGLDQEVCSCVLPCLNLGQLDLLWVTFFVHADIRHILQANR